MKPEQTPEAALARRNQQAALAVVAVAVVITALPWALAPFYKHLCGVLGFNSTSDKSVDELLSSRSQDTVGLGARRGQVQVFFMAVTGTLPITMHPAKPFDWVKPGRLFSIDYRLTNLSDRAVDFRAIHSTAPATDAFELIKCFCDDHRVLGPHQTETYPVVFRLRRELPQQQSLTVAYTLFDYRPKPDKGAARSAIAAPAFFSSSR